MQSTMSTPSEENRPVAVSKCHPADGKKRDIFHKNRLREWRKKQGLKQWQLAKLIGMGQSTISKIERGDRDTLIKHAPALARALGCDILDLLSSEVCAQILGGKRKKQQSRNQPDGGDIFVVTHGTALYTRVPRQAIQRTRAVDEAHLMAYQVGRDIVIVDTKFQVGPDRIGPYHQTVLLKNGGEMIFADGLVKQGLAQVAFSMGDNCFPVVDPVEPIGAVVAVLPGPPTSIKEEVLNG